MSCLKFVKQKSETKAADFWVAKSGILKYLIYKNNSVYYLAINLSQKDESMRLVYLDKFLTYNSASEFAELYLKEYFLQLVFETYNDEDKN